MPMLASGPWSQVVVPLSCTRTPSQLLVSRTSSRIMASTVVHHQRVKHTSTQRRSVSLLSWLYNVTPHLLYSSPTSRPHYTPTSSSGRQDPYHWRWYRQLHKRCCHIQGYHQGAGKYQGWLDCTWGKLATARSSMRANNLFSYRSRSTSVAVVLTGKKA